MRRSEDDGAVEFLKWWCGGLWLAMMRMRDRDALFICFPSSAGFQGTLRQAGVRLVHMRNTIG